MPGACWPQAELLAGPPEPLANPGSRSLPHAHAHSPSAASVPVGLGSAATPVGGVARCSPGHVTGANMAAPIGVHLFVRGGKRSANDSSRAPRPEIKPRVDAARTCVLSARPTHYTHWHAAETQTRLSTPFLDHISEWLVLEICGSLPKVFLPHFTCVINVTDRRRL